MLYGTATSGCEQLPRCLAPWFADRTQRVRSHVRRPVVTHCCAWLWVIAAIAFPPGSGRMSFAGLIGPGLGGAPVPACAARNSTA